MQGRNVAFVPFLFALVAFFSFDSYIYEDEPIEEDGTLSVTTRAANDNSTVSYPVELFVFSDSKCCAIQEISSASDDVRICLQPGEYNVYAIGGISNYNIPDKESISKFTLLGFKNGKTKHGNLMVAQSNVLLEAGKGTSLDLKLKRKVMMLNEVKLQNIPITAKEVRVSLSPLYNTICFDGSYGGGDTTYEVELDKQADGTTWSASPKTYLLPETDKTAQIMITITFSNGTSKSYLHKSTEPLKENSHVNIVATYEALKTTLIVNIQGEEWGDDKNIEYIFMENESDSTQEDNHDKTTAEAISVGDFYNGCYVFTVDTIKKMATVLCPDEKDNIIDYYKQGDENNSSVKEALQSFVVPNIKNWRVMTEMEAQIINKNISAVNDALQSRNKTIISDNEYIIMNRLGYRKCKLTAKKFGQSAYPDLKTVLRPVADIYWD